MAMKIHAGSCHCGAVRFEAEMDLSKGTTRCNCLIAGAEVLSDYQWTAPRTCGVRAFAYGEPPQGGPFYAIAIAALDDADPDELEGRSNMSTAGMTATIERRTIRASLAPTRGIHGTLSLELYRPGLHHHRPRGPARRAHLPLISIMPIGSIPSRSGPTVFPASALVDGPAKAPIAPAETTLAKWLVMVAKGDFRDLPSIIALDAVYHSPVEWHPYPGRDLVCLLVRTAAGVFEDFKYLREFTSGADVALEFSAHVGDIELRAVHILRFNGAGEIVDIDLIARPAKGVMALGNAVASRAGPQIKAALAGR